MRIDHIAVYVENLERAKDFFVKYFEGHANNKYINESKGFTSYFISFSDGSRLELMNRMDITEHSFTNHLGYAHFAISVGTKKRVQELTWQLQADGYEVLSEPRITGDGYYESCILDAEGNSIEITA